MTVIWYHETKEAPDFDARIAICDEDGTWAYMSEIEALEEENKQLKAEIQKLKEALKCNQLKFIWYENLRILKK